jgi:hypothetical protein
LTSIRELIAIGDAVSLSERYAKRYSDLVDPNVLAAISQIVTDPNARKLGGSADSPWSDETWLTWLRTRVAELRSGSIDDLRSRFLVTPKSFLNTTDGWFEFLTEYSRLAKIMGEIEGWGDESEDWLGFPAATEQELGVAESRLAVSFPASVRAFFLTTNGWKADGWIHPQIHGLNELNWLRYTDPHLHELAKQTESTPGPFLHDPTGERLNNFRLDFGTRVTRALALNTDTNDTGTALLDPFTDNEEWACGVWAHWHTESPWSWDCFSSYMHARYDFLAEMERDA